MPPLVRRSTYHNVTMGSYRNCSIERNTSIQECQKTFETLDRLLPKIISTAITKCREFRMKGTQEKPPRQEMQWPKLQECAIMITYNCNYKICAIT